MYKKGCVPSTKDAGTDGVNGQCPAFLLYQLEVWVLASQNGGRVLSVSDCHRRMHGYIRVFLDALQPVQCACNVSVSYAEVFGRAQPNLYSNLP